MIDHLFTIGDSFTKGIGLDDPQQAYPHVLGKIRGIEVVNDGFAGASHDRILRRATGYLCQMVDEGRHPFVIVGWGNKSRTEIYKGDHPDEEEDDDKYIRYTGLSPRHEPYYKRRGVLPFVSQLYQYRCADADNTRALVRILSLQSLLQSLHVPYLFFNSAWVLKTDNPMGRQINRHRYYGFDNQQDTFHHWTDRHGHRGRTELGHPDAEAHAVWAAHLSSVINDGHLWD